MLRFISRWPIATLWGLTVIAVVLVQVTFLPGALGRALVLIYPYMFVRMWLGWFLRLTGADTPLGPFDAFFFVPLMFAAYGAIDTIIWRFRKHISKTPAEPAHGTPRWERFSEPWRSTAKRTGTLALLIGIVVSISQQRTISLVTGTLAAMIFTLGGHVAEVVWLNRVRQRVSDHRAAQFVARLGFWYVAGGMLYAFGLGTRLIPFDMRHYNWWPYVGLVFAGVELAIHGLRFSRRLPSIFDGRG